MVSNVNEIKPWFREDVARVLMSIYFSSQSAPAPLGDVAQREGYEKGFAAALAAVALLQSSSLSPAKPSLTFFSWQNTFVTFCPSIYSSI